jgi:hypothetical protein
MKLEEYPLHLSIHCLEILKKINIIIDCFVIYTNMAASMTSEEIQGYVAC